MFCRPCDGGTTTHTLGPEARALYRFIEIYAAQENLEPPHILSTCRPAAQQIAMQEAWDRGDRAGLRVRPADPENSKHVPDETGICSAFDLSNNDAWLRQVGQHVLENFPGATWGGIWIPKDLPHFHVEPSRRWISAASFKI